MSNPGAVCAGPHCPNIDSWDNHQAGWRLYGGQVIATTVTDPAGKNRTHEYAGSGYVTGTHDGFGHRTLQKLDAHNRVTQETDTLGRTTRYVYDDKGNKISEIDPLNHYAGPWGVRSCNNTLATTHLLNHRTTTFVKIRTG